MSSGSGGASGGGKSGVFGGAKKLLGFAIGAFVLFAIIPNLDVFMATAESIGGTVAGVVEAIGSLFAELEQAFKSATGE